MRASTNSCERGICHVVVTLLDSTGINTCTGSVTGLVLKYLSRDPSQKEPGPQLTNQQEDGPLGAPKPSADRRVVQEATKIHPSGGEPKEEEKDQRHA